MNTSFFKTVLVCSLDETPAQRGLYAELAANLFSRLNDKPMTAVTADLSDADVDGESGFRRMLRNRNPFALRTPIRLSLAT